MVAETAFVIDDSKSARVMLGRMLKKSGVEVSLFESGEDLIKALDHLDPPNVIFMDHMMPGKDGLETMRVIRQQKPFSEVPVYMYTSKDEVSYASEIAEAGANGVLPKPATPEALSKIFEFGPKAQPPTIAHSEAEDGGLQDLVIALQTRLNNLEESNHVMRDTITALNNESISHSSNENHSEYVTQNAFDAAISKINALIDEKLHTQAVRISQEISSQHVVTDSLKAEIIAIAEAAGEKSAEFHAPKIAESHAEAVAAKVAAAQAGIMTEKSLKAIASQGHGSKILIVICLVLTVFSIGLHFLG